MSKNLPPEGTYRTKGEEEAKKKYAEIFENSSEETQIKLQNFTKYIRRQDATRFLSCFELFKNVLDVKGSIIECGVYRGFTLMSWSLFSAILEPVNLTRRIYGFDTFGGFPSVSEKDRTRLRDVNPEELEQLFNSNEKIGPWFRLIKENFLNNIWESQENPSVAADEKLHKMGECK